MTGESQQPDPAADLDLLFPDREVTVTDPETEIPVDLTVREFRFREGLEAQALARPLTEALADAIEGGAEGAERLEADAIAGALAEHADLWIELVARAAGVTAEWVSGLSDQDGDALSDAMWGANGAFFTRRVVAAVAARSRKRIEAEIGSRLRRSSTPSSGPDTGEDTAT